MSLSGSNGLYCLVTFVNLVLKLYFPYMQSPNIHLYIFILIMSVHSCLTLFSFIDYSILPWFLKSFLIFLHFIFSFCPLRQGFSVFCTFFKTKFGTSILFFVNLWYHHVRAYQHAKSQEIIYREKRQ